MDLDGLHLLCRAQHRQGYPLCREGAPANERPGERAFPKPLEIRSATWSKPARRMGLRSINCNVGHVVIPRKRHGDPG
jgi:hypothetical protein